MCRLAVTGIAMAILHVGTAQTVQQGTPVFRTQTRLLELSVVVQDANGHLVKDLKQEDFEIFDNGVKQDIRLFRLEEYGTSSIEPNTDSSESWSESRPGILSNRPVAESAPPNPPTVLVIDAANTWSPGSMAWADLVYARKEVIRFLQRLHPENRIGIYIVGSQRLWIVREYNQTCAAVLDRLKEWKEEGTKPRRQKYNDVWTEFAVHIGHFDPYTARELQRSQFGKGAVPSPGDFGTLGVIAAIGRHLEAVPGRKNVILVSGTAFLPTDHKNQITALRDIIARNISVYTIDPAGLAPYALDASFVIPSSVTAFSSGRGDLAVQQCLAAAYASKRESMMYLQTSLTDFAETTGGRVFVNTNDVMGAIQKSFEDSQVSYTLGYYPNNRRAGEFHTLRVKARGNRSLTLRHRNGYFDPSPPSTDPERHYRELEQLVWSPVDSSVIELTAGIQPMPGKGAYAVGLRIGVGDLSVSLADDRHTARIEILVAQLDSAGNEYEPQLQTLQLNLKPGSWEEALAAGFAHRVAIKLNPKSLSVRVVVRDLETGDAGTLTIPARAFAVH